MQKLVENELRKEREGGGGGGAAEVAAITLCSLGYVNGLIRNNNKKRSNELVPPHPRLV